MLITRIFRKRVTAVLCGSLVVFLAAVGVAQAIVETEPNDRRADANGPIMNGDTWTGQLGDLEDADYLKLYVAKRSTVRLDVSRSVVLGPNGYFELMTADGNDGIAYVNLGEGETSGQISATLDPGKYVLWIVSVISGDTDGMFWEVRAQGDFVNWAQVQAACKSGKAKLPKLNKAAKKAKKALAKAKKRKKGKKAAVKKAKKKLASSQKAQKKAKAASATICAIEE